MFKSFNITIGIAFFVFTLALAQHDSVDLEKLKGFLPETLAGMQRTGEPEKLGTGISQKYGSGRINGKVKFGFGQKDFTEFENNFRFVSGGAHIRSGDLELKRVDNLGFLALEIFFRNHNAKVVDVNINNNIIVTISVEGMGNTEECLKCAQEIDLEGLALLFAPDVPKFLDMQKLKAFFPGSLSGLKPIGQVEETIEGSGDTLRLKVERKYEGDGLTGNVRIRQGAKDLLDFQNNYELVSKIINTDEYSAKIVDVTNNKSFELYLKDSKEAKVCVNIENSLIIWIEFNDVDDTFMCLKCMRELDLDGLAELVKANR